MFSVSKVPAVIVECLTNWRALGRHRQLHSYIVNYSLVNYFWNNSTATLPSRRQDTATARYLLYGGLLAAWVKDLLVNGFTAVCCGLLRGLLAVGKGFVGKCLYSSLLWSSPYYSQDTILRPADVFLDS
jgi:hypothetical protein